MSNRQLRVVAITLLVALATGGGCKSSMLPGEKYYIDSPGVGIAYLPRTPEQVSRAALAALQQDLGFTIVSEQPLVARTATDRNVRIEVYADGDSGTKMQIDMAPDTPEEAIREIMSKIEARLQ